MNSGRSGDSARELQETYSQYKVYDQHYEEIGKVDDIFVDENDQPEYIGVKMGFLGMNSTVVPIDLVRINDRRGLIEVAASKDKIENGPSFDDDAEISSDHEAEIRSYYGLDRATESRESSYGGYTTDVPPVDLEHGERTDHPDAHVASEERVSEIPKDETPTSPRESSREEAGGRSAAREVRNEDEVRVQRTEEELRADVRQREAGSVNVRKRVRTDHERLRVPKRHEEIHVERVPVEESSSPGVGGSTAESAAPQVESGEDEIRIPIVEEEVVVEKRPVVKEEIRIRKNVVEEEEIIEEDVRKEEIEVDKESKQ